MGGGWRVGRGQFSSRVREQGNKGEPSQWNKAETAGEMGPKCPGV